MTRWMTILCSEPFEIVLYDEELQMISQTRLEVRVTISTEVWYFNTRLASFPGQRREQVARRKTAARQTL